MLIMSQKAIANSTKIIQGEFMRLTLNKNTERIKKSDYIYIISFYVKIKNSAEKNRNKSIVTFVNLNYFPQLNNPNYIYIYVLSVKV